MKIEGNGNLSIHYHSPEERTEIGYLNCTAVKEVRNYHSSLPGYSKTPLISLTELAKNLGVKAIYVKDESHRFGLNAFKSLGVSFAIGKILQEELDLSSGNLSFDVFQDPAILGKVKNVTFVSVTAGNHGRGLAWFARKIGAKSVIFLPQNAVKARVDAIRREGAEVKVINLNYDAAVQAASDLAEKNGWILVQDTAWEGYEDIPTRITQGYSTMSSEALEQLDQLEEDYPTHVFLQAGVGSMAGSVVGHFVNQQSKLLPKFIIAEPENAACIYKSANVNDGKPHGVSGTHSTMMAGLACGEPNINTWEILRDYASAYISCSDSFSAKGMRRFSNPIQGDPAIVSGESGAVGLGLTESIMTDESLIDIKDNLKLNDQSVVLLFNTEGNTDPENYNKILERYNKEDI